MVRAAIQAAAEQTIRFIIGLAAIATAIGIAVGYYLAR